MWDTGATHSVITQSTAKKLGLIPIGKVESHHADGSTLVNTYMTHIFLPNDIVLTNIRVTECSDNTRFEVIVGMDIISRGDFAFTNKGGKSTFSFRIPSVETIDYWKEFEQAKKDSGDKVKKLMGIKGKKTVDDFHRQLGKLMWEH